MPNAEANANPNMIPDPKSTSHLKSESALIPNKEGLSAHFKEPSLETGDRRRILRVIFSIWRNRMGLVLLTWKNQTKWMAFSQKTKSLVLEHLNFYARQNSQKRKKIDFFKNSFLSSIL
jgi:hypothetical protein